jgi:hypothetical protein
MEQLAGIKMMATFGNDGDSLGVIMLADDVESDLFLRGF